ncbi:methyltransferase [Aquimarina sp. MMG016]|uniref:methyltransferase n=1 Tax=Aquimarina sp. MMG016 TaxID=2822690 RepID=UPI001B3A32C3|nr:methyltransferase [Aquimarina sp. MMG016]MBQ4821784.1 methyltransferase [Aquimarina sp. MMG016]
MRNIIKRIIHPIAKIGFKTYFSKPRKYKFENVEAIVHPGVFPPHLTISTKILLNYLKTQSLKNKTLLELGCGSGIISLFAAYQGAIVTASDINPSALQGLKVSSSKSDLHISIRYSDLFENLTNMRFDYIIINPPYYPKEPKNIKEEAWFCGSNFEYFKKLFFQLPEYVKKDNCVLMILSQDCEIKHIESIASKNNLSFKSILEKKVVGETNFIFKISINEEFN